MGEGQRFELSGPLWRRTIARRDPLLAGRRYRVWLRIASIGQGKVCIWVGGNRTAFFTTPGEHIAEVTAGDGQEVVVQGIGASGLVDGFALQLLEG